MLRLLKIRGHSLTPEYKDGDFVLISKIPVFFNRLRIGDVIVFRHPGYGTMIKKIDSISPDGKAFCMVGSHPLSVDSRQFGPIDRAAVIGKVILHVSKE
jgi:nickel-type superoxide dismutase maturation protease